MTLAFETLEVMRIMFIRTDCMSAGGNRAGKRERIE